MAVRTKAEIMEQIKTLVGDDTSDATLNIISDISDTLSDLETKSQGDGTDWKKKYEDNDAEWRQKYRDRFFNSESGDSQNNEPQQQGTDEPKEPQLKTSFEELFK